MTTEFKLDTSGSVPMGRIEYFWDGSSGFSPFLSPFVQGYLEAMFADPRMPRDFGDDCRYFDYGFRHLAPATLVRVMEDCEQRQRRLGWRNPKSRALGQEFWRRRQNDEFPGSHDGYVPPFPPLTPYLGEDGKIYLREDL